MRYKIEKLEDITDAKDIMNAYLSSSSYKFFKYMMYIIIFLIIFILVWSSTTEKSVVVNAFGEIDAKNNVCNIYIENTNIGYIKENNKVQIEIVSLAKNNYGVINSKIDTISDDVVVDESSYKKYYMVSCHLNKDVLTAKNGDIAKIKNGMEAKINIISYKTTYLKYIFNM